MTQIPVMPFYPDSYIADTRMLTLEEKGAYTDLLFHMWLQGGKLPDDDVRIARLLGVSATAWRRLKQNLLHFFQYSERFFTQKRLCCELENVRNRREKNALNGQRGGQVKAEKFNKNKESDVANATSSLPICHNEIVSENNGDTASKTQTTRARVNLNPSSEESTDSKLSALPVADFNPNKIIFQEGLAYLTASGVANAQARSLLGKWRKAYGNQVVIQALSRASQQGASEPIAFIEGLLKHTASIPAKGTTYDSLTHRDRTSKFDVMLAAQAKSILNNCRINWHRNVQVQWAPETIPVLTVDEVEAAQALLVETQALLVQISQSKDSQVKLSWCLTGLQAIYPIQDLGTKGFQAREHIFQDVLGEYPLDLVEQACCEHARTSDWFPTPHQLITILDPLLARRKSHVEKLAKLIQVTKSEDQ